jgi:hypothetical protein
MRPGNAAVLGLLLGCNSSGTSAGTTEGGADVTSSSSDDGGGQGSDATVDSPAESTGTPCVDLDARVLVPSSDCVYAGSCPSACNGGTASAYACVAVPDAAPTYPAVFSPPVDSVDIVAFEPGAYPWDAAAYLSCAALTCTRWATADHLEGGSTWPGDPCAPGDAGATVATQAWACPTLPGLAPSVAGCFAAGDIQRIGGTGTGIAVNAVWCCPPPAAEAGADEGGDDDAGDAAAD